MVAASSIRRPSPNSARNTATAEILAPVLRPVLGEPDQRDPRRQQAVLRKQFGPPERQAQIRAQPLQVAPHVAALGRVEIERRGGPALRLENRPQQEGAKAHLDACSLGGSGPIRMAAG